MKQILNKLLLLSTSLILFSCQNKAIEEVEFAQFQESIGHLNNYYRIGDTISSVDDLWDDLWRNGNLIDTSFIIKYQLIDTTFNTEEFSRLNTLQDYHCSYVGQLRKGNTYILLTYSIRSGAGDGNPVLTATTFSGKGDLLDFLRFELDGVHDPFYEPINYFSISKDFLIKSTLVKKTFIEGLDSLVLIDSTALSMSFLISNKGKFVPK